jgi:hypothetical protein
MILELLLFKEWPQQYPQTYQMLMAAGVLVLGNCVPRIAELGIESRPCGIEELRYRFQCLKLI